MIPLWIRLMELEVNVEGVFITRDYRERLIQLYVYGTSNKITLEFFHDFSSTLDISIPNDVLADLGYTLGNHMYGS